MLDTQKEAYEVTMRRQRVIAVLSGVAAVICLGFALAAGASAYESGLVPVLGSTSDAALNTTAPAIPAITGAGPEALSAAFSNVAKGVGPAVVHINVVKETPVQTQGFGFGFGMPNDGPERQEGSGSGVIVNANGYIVTNYHVVGKARSIEVKLADGRRMKGSVVGTDEPTDLAVVKVDGSDLPAATLGDSDKMQQGDWVVALGSPFGLEQTITAGIVSATGRRLQASPYDAFIQTDASINPGNSGGPLVNLRGEVIGINTLIFTRSGGSQGIGFAIPTSMVKKVYDQLVSGRGKVVRGYLGISVGDVTEPVAESLGLPRDAKGALVADVASDDSPAAKAGLRSGDVIVSLNGKAIGSGAELTSTVADFAPGTSVDVGFIRDGAEQSVQVTLAERPGTAQLLEEPGPDSEEAPEASPDRRKLGVQVRDLTPEIASQVRARSSAGVVIVNVDPGGPAARSGLRRGDVIVRAGRTAIKSARDLGSAVEPVTSGSQLVLQVERAGRMAFVTVEID